MNNEKNEKKPIDSRIIPSIRNLKDQSDHIRREFKSKTNMPKEIHKNNYFRETSSEKGDTHQIYKNKFSPSTKNIKNYFPDKVYIDGSQEQKPKQFTSYNKPLLNNNNNKIKIISKTKEIIQQNPLLLKTMNYKSNYKSINLNNYNNFKSRKKYVQNLLNDASIKKYKKSCIDIIKNDNEIKNSYETCGFEKTNLSYDNFIYKNFFNNELFMFKLEMLFLDEKNFMKKNFKENFFKKEMKKYLNNYIENNIYNQQINNLSEAIQNTINLISNFDLLHD